MARHDQDEWDITSSVGLTALAVAGARAIESKQDNALIVDPYADALVNAAASDVSPPTQLPSPEHEDDEEFIQVWSQVSTSMGVRSRFFDEFFATCWSAGLTQAVILASGLDARAWRLDWPGQCTVFEIDQPKVLEFKDGVFERMGVEPPCERRAVAIDLREDWPSALTRAGFDPSRPTAWLAEGLLPYLPEEAEKRLLAAIHDLSAPGSRIAVEQIRSPEVLTNEAEEQISRVASRFGIEVADLVYPTDTRPDPNEQLAELGWDTTVTTGTDAAGAYGRHPDGVAKQVGEHQRYVTAQLR